MTAIAPEAASPLCPTEIPILRWTVVDEGTAPSTSHVVDLTRIAMGSKDPKWGFKARPAFLTELAPTLRTMTSRKSRSTANRLLKEVRVMLRWLDWYERVMQVTVASVLDLDDTAGPLLIEWLRSESAGRSEATLDNEYRGVRKIVERAFRMANRPMVWSTSPFQGNQDATNHLPPKVIAELLRAAVSEARHVKRRHVEGRRLAAAGNDPRSSGDWHKPECRAYYFRRVLKLRPLLWSELKAPGKGHASFANACQDNDGPEFLEAEGLRRRRLRGTRAHYRWFLPHQDDLLPFLLIVAIRTGWNLSTILAMDRTSWRRAYALRINSAGHPSHMVVHSTKRRGARVDPITGAAIPRSQTTISSIRPEWHVYRVVHYVIRMTMPLVREIDRRIAELGARARQRPHDAGLADELRSLRANRNKVWLCLNESAKGVHALSSETETDITRAWQAFVRRHGLRGDDGKPLGLSFRKLRDAPILFVYQASGQNLLLAQLMAEHANVRTTVRYLRRKVVEKALEESFRALLDTAFVEIDAGRFSPRRLRRMLLASGLSEHQAKNSMSPENETVWGNGCAEPTSPPHEIDPDHKGDELCGTQACLDGCPWARWFNDSLRTVARHVIETRRVIASLGAEAIEASTWPSRLARLEALLRRWPRERVRVALADAEADKSPSMMQMPSRRMGANHA